MKKKIYLSLSLLAAAFTGYSQGSEIYSTTQTFDGGYYGVYNTLTFNTGYIVTPRATPATSSAYFTAGSSYVGASNASHVNGYAEKAGTTAFIFPVGNGVNLRPAAMSAPAANGRYQAAYWAVSGSAATLPAGAPFPVTNFSSELTAVSPVEYWDINGATAVNISLTWDANSDLASLLTNEALPYLTIAGWNGTQWVRIPSAMDESSILDENVFSDITAGSITTTSPIVPNTYSAYTFASLAGPDLSPGIAFLPANIIGTKNMGILLNVYEFNDIATSGLITVYIQKDPLYVLAFNPAATTTFGEPVNNASWTFSAADPLLYTLTTNQVIPASGGLAAGFTMTFVPGATKGATVISTYIESGSGGEIDDTNNADDDTMVYKP